MGAGRIRNQIAVIADDLTGAAELAGAALAHGLRAEVRTGWGSPVRSDADVVCFDSGSRSLPESEAAGAAASVGAAVQRWEPARVFKKCDSVLRGHVLAEIHALLEETLFEGAVLVPANPGKGRVIRDGRYLIGDQPLHQTAFSRDPEFPRATDVVAELLGDQDPRVEVPDAGCAREDRATRQSGVVERSSSQQLDKALEANRRHIARLDGAVQRERLRARRLRALERGVEDELCRWLVGQTRSEPHVR